MRHCARIHNNKCICTYTWAFPTEQYIYIDIEKKNLNVNAILCTSYECFFFLYLRASAYNEAQHTENNLED